MHLSPSRLVGDGVVEQTLTLGDVPGFLWTPHDASGPVPLVLLGHPGGLQKMYPRLLERARQSVAQGFAAATIELPGSGDRPPSTDAEAARADLRAALAAGQVVSEELVDRLVLPLVEAAVPEWQALLDALLAIPGIDGPVAYSGGFIAVGTRLALVEPRIVTAALFAGSYVPRRTLEEARQIEIPLLVLLQWDDEHNDRQAALDLFDAFASPEKTLHANLGGHTGVPRSEGEDAGRFLARHLR